MKHTRRWAVPGAATAAGVMLAGATAWACVAGPTLNLSPATLKAGQETTLSGFAYNGELPIVVRFNALDGPVLGTFQPTEGRFGDPELLTGKVTIPADTKPGSYVLIATQTTRDGSLAQVPVRALVTVTGPTGAPVLGAPVSPVETGRPVGPVRQDSSVTMGALLLVGLGTAGVAMFVAGMAAFLPTRRRAEPEVARATR